MYLYSAICFSIQNICFCSTGPECEPLPPQAETEHHDGAAAVVQCELIWKEREILKVYFMNPPVLDSWGIGVTTQQILDWANEAWSKDPDSKVPKFKLYETSRRADVRVKFAGKPIKSTYSQLDFFPIYLEMKGTKSEGCWSMVGMHATKAKKDSPTMVLDLTDEFIAVKKTKNQYRRSLVIHEFGHALGLEHEHQRSELWEVLEKYIDKEKMNDTEGVSTKKSKNGVSTFGMDWTNMKFKEGKKFNLSTDYDPLSIMHYG